MRTLTMARKPLLSTTIDTLPCGSLHIDAVRVAYQGQGDMTSSVGKGVPGRLNPGSGSNLPYYKERWGVWTVSPDGRYPSNVLLIGGLFGGWSRFFWRA